MRVVDLARSSVPDLRIGLAADLPAAMDMAYEG